jgi:hypothetical protein
MLEPKGNLSEREKSLCQPDLTCPPGFPSSHPANRSLIPASAPLDAVGVVKFLHWGEASVVTLHRKFHDKWQDLGGIQLHEAHEHLPRMAEYLRFDSYFSINSTGLGCGGVKKSEVTGLPRCSRAQERLRWLNALYVDFDFAHDDNRPEYQSFLERFHKAREKNRIPAPSLIALSGRGFWALWPLVSFTDRRTPVPAFPDKIDLYRRINQALVRCFRDLGADASSTDAARVMRVPNSINTKAHPSCSQVQFYRVCDELHTLPEIADFLGVGTLKLKLAGLHGNNTKDEAKVRAALARWRKPLLGFLALWKLRGHFVKGVRRNAVYIYALLLRRNRVSDDIPEACRKLAASCRPQLGEADIRDCISSSATAARAGFEFSIRNAKIIQMLRISPEEQAQLADWFTPAPRPRSDRIAARHAVIVMELRQAGCFTRDRNLWTPTREMSRMLASKHGLPISHVTLTKDYRAIHTRTFAGSDFTYDEEPGKFRGS